MKVIHHPHGHKVKMGRKRPIAHGPRFRLKNYLTRSMPSPPLVADYTQKAATSLSRIYMNDTLGCCVIAGIGHVEGVLTGNAGTTFLYSDQDIETLYSAIGGYVPGDPSTDQGCDEVTALNYWQNNGAPAGSHKIAGWMSVNAADPVEVRTALWLFENLYFGVELPDDWVNPMPAGNAFTWDVAGDPDPENGHCFIGAGYTTYGVVIDTWGMVGLLTNAAIEKYCAASAGGALYTVVSQDALSSLSQKAPNGFDWTQLSADFDSMGGDV